MGVLPWDTEKCRPTDWDPSLKKMYDVQNRILIGEKPMNPNRNNPRPVRNPERDTGNGQTSHFQGLRVSKEQVAQVARAGSQMWKSAQEAAPKMVEGMQRAVVAGAGAGAWRPPSRIKVPLRGALAL